MAGRPRLYDDPFELDTECDLYFSTLDPYKPTVNGLALFLGFADKSSVYEYRDRPEFSYPIKKALTKIELAHETNLYGNTVTGSIFALKNMGWKDKTEVEQSGHLAVNWHEEKTYLTK